MSTRVIAAAVAALLTVTAFILATTRAIVVI